MAEHHNVMNTFGLWLATESLNLEGQDEREPNYTPVIITPQAAFSLFTEKGTLMRALQLHISHKTRHKKDSQRRMDQAS